MYCIAVDPELPLKDDELQQYADRIVDIWKRVGVELDLELSTLNAIELSNPNNNESAALQMLKTWKEMKGNPPRKVLQQATEDCQTQANKGSYLVFYNSTHTPDSMPYINSYLVV